MYFSVKITSAMKESAEMSLKNTATFYVQTHTGTDELTCIMLSTVFYDILNTGMTFCKGYSY